MLTFCPQINSDEADQNTIKIAPESGIKTNTNTGTEDGFCVHDFDEEIFNVPTRRRSRFDRKLPEV